MRLKTSGKNRKGCMHVHDFGNSQNMNGGNKQTNKS